METPPLMRLSSRDEMNRRQHTPSPKPEKTYGPNKKFKDIPVYPSPKPVDTGRSSYTDQGDDKKSTIVRGRSRDGLFIQDPENLPLEFEEKTLSRTHTLSTTKKLRNPFQDEGSIFTSPDNRPNRRPALTYNGPAERGTVILPQSQRIGDELERLRLEVAKLRNENIRLQKEQTRIIISYEDEVKRARKKSDSLTNIDDRVIQAEQEKKRLQEALDNYINKTESLSKAQSSKIKELEDELSNQRVKVVELQNQLKGFKPETVITTHYDEIIANLRKDNQHLYKAWTAERENSERLTRLLDTEATKSKGTINELEENIKKLQDEKAKLTQQIQFQSPQISARDLGSMDKLIKEKDQEAKSKEMELNKILIDKTIEIASLRDQVARSIDDKTKIVLMMIEVERLHGVIAQITNELQSVKDGFKKEFDALAANYELKNQVLEHKIASSKTLDPEQVEQRMNQYELKIQLLEDQVENSKQEALEWKDKFESEKRQAQEAIIPQEEEEKEKRAGFGSSPQRREEIQKATNLILELKNRELEGKASGLEERTLLLTADLERLRRVADDATGENESLKEKCSELETNYEKAISSIKDKIEEFVRIRISEELKSAEFEWMKEKDAKDRLIEAQRKLIHKMKDNVGNMNDDLKLLNEIKVREQDVLLRMEKQGGEMSNDLKNV